MLLFLRNILQLILAPARGWEDISACRESEALLLRTGLYPLITLAALSEYGRLIYVELSLSVLTVMAFVVFVSFFITYFLAKVSFKTLFYRYCDGEPNEHKYSTVILYCVSLLALSTLICNMMPVNFGLQYLFPLGVAMILWKANIYLAVRGDKDFQFIFFGILTIILPPLLMQSLFTMILE